MNISLYLLMLVNIFFSNHQTIRIKYTERYKIKTLGNIKPIENSIKEKQEKQNNNIPIQYSSSNGLERFTDYEYIYSNNKSSFKLLTMTGTIISVNHYKDYNSNLFYSEKTFLKENNRREVEAKNMKNLEWKIDFKKTKKILNYNTFYAYRINEKGKTIEAWFSKEIPVSDGPYNEYGLPGLMLEWTIGSFTITATQVDILPENTEIALPKKE
jgi:GLPGLI family protein